jgi:hypothetical protein
MGCRECNNDYISNPELSAANDLNGLVILKRVNIICSPNESLAVCVYFIILFLINPIQGKDIGLVIEE